MWLVAIGTLLAIPAMATTVELQIQVETEPAHNRFGCVSVSGVDPSELARLRQRTLNLHEWQQILSVKLQPRTSGLTIGELPNVTGRYELLDSGFSFTPRFRPALGLTYQIRVKVGDHAPATGKFKLGETPLPSASARIDAIYPSARSIPENTLRFYVQFSRPMQRVQVAKRIRLLDENNEVVENAFIVGPLGELWDNEQRRLTLLLDPGRIKRGVGPNRELGPALVTGRARTLVIDQKFKDAKGRPLKTEFRKTYRIVEAIREAVTPGSWLVTRPEANSREPLHIQFPRALDRGMLSHAISVYEEQRLVKGKISVSTSETEWSFIPEKPWQRKLHDIRVATNLEDISGNNVVAPFDVAVKIPGSTISETLQIPFTPIEEPELSPLRRN